MFPMSLQQTWNIVVSYLAFQSVSRITPNYTETTVPCTMHTICINCIVIILTCCLKDQILMVKFNQRLSMLWISARVRLMTLSGIGPRLVGIEVACELLQQSEDIMQKNQCWNWDSMSYGHFRDRLETIPTLIFWEKPYRYVLRTGKDQDHRQHAWMAEYCYLIIWKLMQ